MVGQKYQLVRELGAGGMGAVYEGLHTGVGKRVAVKLLHKELLDLDPTTLTRLEREARLAGTLESPHIAQVFDVGIDDESGAPYLVLEYLEGLDLEQTVHATGPLPYPLALRLMAQACMGLKRAHAAGVIHRDIKPANLFVSQRDDDIVLKLLDFGIAKPFDEQSRMESPSLTRTGSLIGSPLYMSPEQARGLKTIDHRADLWSLGVALYALLVGKPPNDHIESLGDLIFSICSKPAPSVRELDPSIPEAVANIVAKALALEPADRFQSAEAMYDAIVAALGTDAKGSARHAVAANELPPVVAAVEAIRARAASAPKLSPLASSRGGLGAKPTSKSDTGNSGTALMAGAPTERKPLASGAGALSSSSSDAGPTSSPFASTEAFAGADPGDTRSSGPVALAQSSAGNHAASTGGHGASVLGVERPNIEPSKKKPPIALYAGGVLALVAAAAIGFGMKGGPTGATTSRDASVGAASAPEVSEAPSAAPSASTEPAAQPTTTASAAEPAGSALAVASSPAAGSAPPAGSAPLAGAAPPIVTPGLGPRPAGTPTGALATASAPKPPPPASATPAPASTDAFGGGRK